MPESAPVPTQVRYMPMILDVLRKMRGIAKAAAVKAMVADKLIAVGEQIPDTVLSSGAPKFANDLQWARFHLIKGGLLEPKDVAGYGNWQLTSKGWNTLLTEADAKAIYASAAGKDADVIQSDSPAPAEDAQQLPLPGLYSYKEKLAKILKSMPAGGFERLCTDIMFKHGFDGPVTKGKTGDGGIDGEGMLAFGDGSLVKIKVAWQCKRFKDATVGAQVVRDFRGSLDGKTQFGLILTTSTFTEAANAEARRPGATPIELVGLDRLISILEEKQMGVKMVMTFEVVDQFFNQYLQQPTVGGATPTLFGG